MKYQILILALISLFSCSNKEAEELVLKVHELQAKVEHLTQERDKLLDSIKSVNIDSLKKIAARWEYGRDTWRYEDDYKGGNSMSWRWACSHYQLKFDTRLLDAENTEASNDSDFRYKDEIMTDLIDNYSYGESNSKFVVNTRFEADRFNYLLSTLMVNVYAELIRKKAADLYQREGLPRSEGWYVDEVMGLLYKKMYNSMKDYDKSYKVLKESLEQMQEYGFELF